MVNIAAVFCASLSLCKIRREVRKREIKKERKKHSKKNNKIVTRTGNKVQCIVVQCGTCAMRRRKRVILTRVSPLLPMTVGTGVGFSGAGAALAAAAAGAAAALTGLGAAAWDAVAVGA